AQRYSRALKRHRRAAALGAARISRRAAPRRPERASEMNGVHIELRRNVANAQAGLRRRCANVEAGAMRPKLGNAVEFPGPEESAHCWNLVRRCAADHAPPPRSCRPKSRIRTNRTVFRQGGENCVTYERVALAPHAVSRQIAC